MHADKFVPVRCFLYIAGNGVNETNLSMSKFTASLLRFFIYDRCVAISTYTVHCHLVSSLYSMVSDHHRQVLYPTLVDRHAGDLCVLARLI